MATIDLEGKWNLRYKGIELNGTIYPIIELYFNLGYAVQLNDDLLFAPTMRDFANDLMIRYNALGSDLYYLVCGGDYESPLDFHEVYPNVGNKTVTDGNFTLSQTDTYHLTATEIVISLKYNTTELNLAMVDGVTSYSKSVPVMVVRDEYQDKILGFRDVIHGEPIAQFPYTESSNAITFVNTVKILNGFVTCKTFPIAQGLNNRETAKVTLIINGSDVPIKPYYPDTPDSDPYNPNAEPGGGDGESQPPDSITDPALPTISSVDTGFITLYKPSISQLNNLASWMWGSLDVDLFKRVMQSPMDAILGLSILPGIVPSGSSSSVKIGNVDSGVSMSKVSSQYVKFDCGSLTVKRKWGAFLDYSPYTKIYLYLPFIGIRSIETDSIMETSVQIKYNIDVMSGACCAFVIANGTTLYSFIGQCSCSVPVTGRDWTNLINGVLGAVSGVASAAGSAAHGNAFGAVSGIASAASSALSAKPTIEHSGSMGGMGGLLGIKRPYFIVERPVQAVPGHQNEVIGYPSFTYKHVGNLSGYTEFEQIHLEGLPCTNEELDEIENILLTGVIL